MKNTFLNKSILFIKNYSEYSDDDLTKIKYGLEGLYLTFSKILFIILISIFLSILKETVIILLLFNIIRYFGFGFHAKNSIICLFMSIFLFSIFPYIILNINYSYIISIIFSIIFSIFLLIFAPADTEKRPFYNKRKRIIRKILTFLISIIYSFITIYYYNYSFSKLFFISNFIEVIVTNPLLYKLLGHTYKNH